METSETLTVDSTSWEDLKKEVIERDKMISDLEADVRHKEDRIELLLRKNENRGMIIDILQKTIQGLVSVQ